MNEYQYYLDKKYLKQILDFYIKHELIDAWIKRVKNKKDTKCD
jgi:hypothetical protein